MEEYNALTNEEFEKTFKNLIELCPWIAKSLAYSCPFKSPTDLFEKTCDLLDSLPWSGNG